MLLRLQGASAVFMQLINEVLHEHLYKEVLVYMYDILIYSKMTEEHVKLVREVLRKLLDAKLYAKLLKCASLEASMNYLGYWVSSERVEMNHGEVKPILEWEPLPQKNPESSCKASWALPTSPGSLFHHLPKLLC